MMIAKGSKIYINRGTREGVTMGQTFDVGKAEVIRDPDTGEILDQSTEKIGTIKVVKLKEKLAVCEVVEGGDIKKGMIVVLQE